MKMITTGKEYFSYHDNLKRIQLAIHVFFRYPTNSFKLTSLINFGVEGGGAAAVSQLFCFRTKLISNRKTLLASKL